jgi:hypothetical protein
MAGYTNTCKKSRKKVARERKMGTGKRRNIRDRPKKTPPVPAFFPPVFLFLTVTKAMAFLAPIIKVTDWAGYLIA